MVKMPILVSFVSPPPGLSAYIGILEYGQTSEEQTKDILTVVKENTISIILSMRSELRGS